MGRSLNPRACVQVRGLTKFGGRLELGTHVESIRVEGERAVGVELRNGVIITATKAVRPPRGLGCGLMLSRRGCGLREGECERS